MATKAIPVVHVLALLLIGFQIATGFECRDDPEYLSPSSGLSCAAHGRWLSSSSSSNGGDDGSSSSQDCVSKWLDGNKKRNVHELCDATSSFIVECLKVYTYSEQEILDVQKHCPKACRSLDLLCDDGSNSYIPSVDQTEVPSMMPTITPHSDITTRVNSSIHLVEATEQSSDLKREEEGSSRRILVIIGYVTASISALGIIGCTVISIWQRIKDKADQKRRKRRLSRRRRRRRRDKESRRHRSRNHRNRRKDQRITRKRHRDCIERDIHHDEHYNSNGIGELRINIDHHEAGRKKPTDNTIDCVLSINLPAWCDEDLDHELPFDYDIEQGGRHDDEFRENEQLESKVSRTKEDGGSTMCSWFGDATNSIIQPTRGSSREIIPDDLSLTPNPRRRTSPGCGRRTKRRLNNDY